MKMINIKNEKLFYIGGCVRDKIINKKSFDTDLTYVGNAIEFAQNNPDFKIIQINEPFGTVKIEYNGEQIDIASTRCEIYPKKGHLPVVDKIGCSLKEDVLRRDFTINALAQSTLTGEIIDYTGGLDDIKNKKLRVLHDKSFIDDPTRILRALKFSVRFGFDLEDNTAKLEQNYLKNINYDMSYKRLKKELTETFNLNSWNAYKKFVSRKIYKLIAPMDFEIPKFDFSQIIEKYNIKEPWIIYVGLLPDISSLPLTKNEKKIIEDFNNLKAQNFKTDFEIYKAFQNLQNETLIMYSTINADIVEKYFEKLKNIKIEITGDDIQNLGIKPSAQYGKCLDYILEKKINNPQISKAQEIDLIREFFSK